MQYHITTTSGLSWTLGDNDLERGDLEFAIQDEHLTAFVMI